MPLGSKSSIELPSEAMLVVYSGNSNNIYCKHYLNIEKYMSKRFDVLPRLVQISNAKYNLKYKETKDYNETAKFEREKNTYRIQSVASVNALRGIGIVQLQQWAFILIPVALTQTNDEWLYCKFSTVIMSSKKDSTRKAHIEADLGMLFTFDFRRRSFILSALV